MMTNDMVAFSSPTNLYTASFITTGTYPEEIEIMDRERVIARLAKGEDKRKFEFIQADLEDLESIYAFLKQRKIKFKKI